MLKDLDENKPTGSVKIRVETIDYFLRRYREDIIRRSGVERRIEDELDDYARRLRLLAYAEPPEARSELIQIGA